MWKVTRSDFGGREKLGISLGIMIGLIRILVRSVCFGCCIARDFWDYYYLLHENLGRTIDPIGKAGKGIREKNLSDIVLSDCLDIVSGTMVGLICVLVESLDVGLLVWRECLGLFDESSAHFAYWYDRMRKVVYIKDLNDLI